MGIFSKKDKKNDVMQIPFFHKMTGKSAPDYSLPCVLKNYYYCRFPHKKSTFMYDVEEFISSCNIDIYNIKYINNRIRHICLQAVNDLEKQHINRQNNINVIIANRMAYAKSLDIQIQELQKTIQIQESEISKEDK